MMLSSSSLALNVLMCLWGLKAAITEHFPAWTIAAARATYIGTIITVITLGVIITAELLEISGYHNRLARWLNKG